MAKIRLLLLSVLLLAIPASGSASEGAIVIIVHPSNPAKSLDRSTLRPIFQTTKTSWDHGGKVIVLNLPDSNSLRRGVDAAVLGLDPDRVSQYWIDRKIRGGAPPPKAVSGTALMLKVVAAKPTAIGYVSEAEVDKSVKVVARIVDGSIQ